MIPFAGASDVTRQALVAAACAISAATPACRGAIRHRNGLGCLAKNPRRVSPSHVHVDRTERARLNACPANSSGGRIGAPRVSRPGAMSKQAMMDAKARKRDWSAKCRPGQRLQHAREQSGRVGREEVKNGETGKEGQRPRQREAENGRRWEGDSPSAESERVVGGVHVPAALRVLLALEPLGVEVLGVRVELLVVEDRPVPRGVEEGKSVPVRQRRAVALEHAPHVRDALRGRGEWR